MALYDFKNLIKRTLSSVILITISFYTIFFGSYLFIFFISIALVISLIEWHNMSFKKYYYFPGIFFLIISFYSAYLIRNDSSEYALFNFFLILNICILTDTGGFFFGKFFKGPKITSISPNKTYSGAIGGIILAIMGSLVYYNFIDLFIKKSDLTVSKIFIIVFVISFISQLGDLIISFFKRLSNIKDTGNIIPGHGGILDRIDGMVFAFPLSYYLNILQ